MYYAVYRDEVMSLARSVVIKFDHIAQAINDGLRELKYPVSEDPTTWKYYQNMAGIYHPTDTMMTVRSMDTLETIEFTKENMRLHRATAREYTAGSIYYNNLVAKYPTQSTLINGILSPVDITKAIDSHDGDILYYDPKYVESNEDNFERELQSFVTTFITKWYNEQYTLIDDLYLPSFIGMLYQQLPMAIFNIRLANAKTPRAHSFHIREYLASNGRLDSFIPYLTKKQQLWLYRNVRFLQRNVGKQEIFDRLVGNILTPRGIPLIKYEIRQNVELMPNELRPRVELVKKDINFNTIQPGNDKVTVAAVLERESTLARDNPLVQYDTEVEIHDQVSSDQFGQLPTKVLDSEVIDRSNSAVRSRLSVLLNEWVHLASSNRYRAYVSIPNPRTGEYMSMTVKDALIVAIYAYSKTRGEPIDTIPRVIAYDVLRSPLPAYAELEQVVDKRYMPDGMIQAIMDRVTPLTEYISTEKFYLDCANLHSEYLKLWELYSFQEHYLTRGFCEQVVRMHFMHIKCSLVDEVLSFEQFFKDSGFPLADLGMLELEQLLTDTVNIATGSNLVKVVSLGEIQRELLSLMGRLSSYPLQYLRNVNYTDFHLIGTPAIRLGDYVVDTKSFNKVVTTELNVVKARAVTSMNYDITQDNLLPNLTISGDTDQSYTIDPLIVIRERFNNMGHYRLNVLDVGVGRVSLTVEHTVNDTGVLEQYNESDDPEWPVI
jgi:hypothetical protein